MLQVSQFGWQGDFRSGHPDSPALGFARISPDSSRRISVVTPDSFLAWFFSSFGCLVCLEIEQGSPTESPPRNAIWPSSAGVTGALLAAGMVKRLRGTPPGCLACR